MLLWKTSSSSPHEKSRVERISRYVRPRETRRPLRRSQKGSIAGRLLKWIGLLIVACVLMSVAMVLALRWITPPITAYMLEARAQAMAEGDRTYRTDYEWVTLEHISPHAAIAVVASEDQQF